VATGGESGPENDPVDREIDRDRAGEAQRNRRPANRTRRLAPKRSVNARVPNITAMPTANPPIATHGLCRRTLGNGSIAAAANTTPAATPSAVCGTVAKYRGADGRRTSPRWRCAMQLPKSHVLDVLRRAGWTHELSTAEATLPDPVDLDRDEPLLASLGITRGELMDEYGASP
jgi:hypothetical protein